MTCVYLSAEDVLAIAELAVDDQDVAVRDAGLLESAVHRPPASMFGQEAYADLFGRAAARPQSLTINCVVFLDMNDAQLRPDSDAAERLVIAVATGDVDDVKVISEALRELAE